MVDYNNPGGKWCDVKHTDGCYYFLLKKFCYDAGDGNFLLKDGITIAHAAKASNRTGNNYYTGVPLVELSDGRKVPKKRCKYIGGEWIVKSKSKKVLGKRGRVRDTTGARKKSKNRGQ